MGKKQQDLIKGALQPLPTSHLVRNFNEVINYNLRINDNLILYRMRAIEGIIKQVDVQENGLKRPTHLFEKSALVGLSKEDIPEIMHFIWRSMDVERIKSQVNRVEVKQVPLWDEDDLV